MEQRDYMVILYDFYGELLTKKQKLYFEEYYFRNLSLGEISDNLKVSRNAIHKCITGVEKKLEFYEEKLRLFYKSNVIRDIIKEEKNEEVKNKLKELI